MNIDATAVNAMLVDARVKTLTALMAQGDDSVVAGIVSRASQVQVHELCMRALRLLTDSRLELAGLKKTSVG